MSLKMIIFDMDGLLLDSEQLYKKGWLKVAADHQIALDEKEINGWSGQSLIQTEAKLLALVGTKEMVATLRKEREVFIQEELAKGQVKFKPYGKEVLALAKEKGLILALATSTYEKRAASFLDKLDFRKYFDYLTFGDQVTAHKPDPEVYLTSLKKAGISASEALAAEDSISGATAATRAGLQVVFVPDTAAGNHYSEAEKAPLNIFMESSSLEEFWHYLKNLA